LAASFCEFVEGPIKVLKRQKEMETKLTKQGNHQQSAQGTGS